jgi:hypothetical protein
MTSAITGGWGFFEVAQTTLGMAEVADPSIQIPVGTPIPGDSVVPSSDHLVPGSGTPYYLQCQIEPNPGFFIIEIYDTTGKKIKTLRSGYITSGSVINLAWDGLDNYASPVPDGIYFIFAKTPTLSKILPIQLVR